MNTTERLFVYIQEIRSQFPQNHFLCADRYMKLWEKKAEEILQRYPVYRNYKKEGNYMSSLQRLNNICSQGTNEYILSQEYKDDVKVIQMSRNDTLPPWIFDLKKYNINIKYDTESFVIQTPWKSQRIYRKKQKLIAFVDSDVHIHKTGGEIWVDVSQTQALVEMLFYSWVSTPEYKTKYWCAPWIKLFVHYRFLSRWNVFWINTERRLRNVCEKCRKAVGRTE